MERDEVIRLAHGTYEREPDDPSFIAACALGPVQAFAQRYADEDQTSDRKVFGADTLVLIDALTAALQVIATEVES